MDSGLAAPPDSLVKRFRRHLIGPYTFIRRVISSKEIDVSRDGSFGFLVYLRLLVVFVSGMELRMTALAFTDDRKSAMMVVLGCRGANIAHPPRAHNIKAASAT